MIVNLYCSWSHFVLHAKPVFDALPEEWKGGLYGKAFNVRKQPPPNQPCIVAGWEDGQRVRTPILVEHGIGQAYGNSDPAYSGGRGWDHALLFLCPNEEVANRWREQFDVPAVVVGDPSLDRFVSVPEWKRTPDPVVAFAFHHDPRIATAPESRWALPEWRPWLPTLLKAFSYRVIGTGHPRAWKTLKPIYESAGIEAVANFTEVVERADVMACDNTSAGWEWVAIGRPVVWLGSSVYRKDVVLPPRFPPIYGEEVTYPEGLVEAVRRASRNLSSDRDKREKAARRLYGRIDGKAGYRGARAIVDLLGAGG